MAEACARGIDTSLLKKRLRLRRQFLLLGRLVPVLKGPVVSLLGDRWRPVRFPLGILLVLAGVLSILPVFGLWMLPLGLLLLAVDIPPLRAPVTGVLIRARLCIRSRRRQRAH